EIGIGLAGFGFSFIFLGILLFFDRGLLAIGNVLFISGLTLVVGVERVFRFFFQSHKMKATSFFLGGIIIVLIGWPFVGIVVELYGFILLFGNKTYTTTSIQCQHKILKINTCSGFLPIAVNFLRRVPIISMFLNFPGISYV
ncbi:hypothetical protein HELRODRAFT_145992, partial [Helobdella robusta]|uniref:Uncharacterized protein n=1 Tax=Helobdella robusta TaxID=6412 RepID=T1EJP5_HELRO